MREINYLGRERLSCYDSKMRELEERLRQLAQRVLSPDQIEELRDEAADWRRERVISPKIWEMRATGSLQLGC